MKTPGGDWVADIHMRIRSGTPTRRPGARGTALPHPLMWAFNRATGRWHGKRGPNRGPGVVARAHGYTIVAAQRTPVYGHSVHSGGRLDHVADTLWTAWRDGRMVAAMVRWMCGATTVWFELVDEPIMRVCPMCLLRVALSMEDAP